MSENKGVYQEGIKRIDKAERESFVSLQKLYLAIAEMLGVHNDEEITAKIKQLIEYRLNELYYSAHGTTYSAKEFWDGKIEELENLLEKIEEI